AVELCLLCFLCERGQKLNLSHPFILVSKGRDGWKEMFLLWCKGVCLVMARKDTRIVCEDVHPCSDITLGKLAEAAPQVVFSLCMDSPCGEIYLTAVEWAVNHALTATVDVPAVYLQQFWRTVSKVPDTEDTIKFMLDTQQFIYTVDMFRDTLHLPVETLENTFVAPANIHTIEAFMNIVGYQGVVDKVSAFFTKNLAQPWHTIFKVFNRCLTTRTSSHDQTKINILQLFHVKKEAIRYPRFIKLIVTDLMKKFPNIPKRFEEDYHSIKDDVPLVSVYTTGNILVRGMLIPDAFLTAEIRETGDFKEYKTVFMKSSGVEEEEETAGESSSRRIIIKKKKQNTPSIPPPGDDRERDEMAEATILSLTLHKTALDAEAKENIAKVQEMLEHKEIDKLVDGDKDEESYASAFVDSVINNDDDDTGSKLEPGSHKEYPEHVSDDDEIKKKDEEVEKEKEVVEIVKDTNVDHTSAKKNNEVVTEKEVVDMSNKKISEELANTVTPTTATSSKTPSTTTRQKKSLTLKTRRLPGSIVGMCRRRGLIRSHIKTKFITREFFMEKIKEVIQHCDKIVPELTVTTTNEMLKKEMPRLVKLVVNKDQEVSPVDISGMVSKEFATHGPKLIEELFRKHMQNTTLNLYPKTKSSTATTSYADLQQLYLSMKTKHQDQAANPEIWEILKAKSEKP
ncbi:hypothetical protein Tco_0951881, partial [Tanacetum coccineum]